MAFLDPSPLPMYLPVISPSSPPKPDEQYILEESTIYIVQDLRSGSSNCWLIRIEETRPGIFRPIHPLSRFSTDEEMPVDFPKSLKFPDYRITDIGTAYSLDHVETSYTYKEHGEIYREQITKIVVSPDPWFVDSDFAYHKGKFYAVDILGRIVVIGSNLVAEEATDLFFTNEGRHFLVKSCDDNLFLICRSIKLSVFKLNEEEKHWDAVDSLGDEIFFIGIDCSYAVRSGEFPGLKGNCIYFYDDSFENENEGMGEFCQHIGLQLMENGTCGPLSDFMEYSTIFWPPPTWLVSNSHASTN